MGTLLMLSIIFFMIFVPSQFAIRFSPKAGLKYTIVVTSIISAVYVLVLAYVVSGMVLS